MSEVLTLNKAGTKMSTPNLTKIIVDGHAERMKHDSDNIEADWKNVEPHVCKVCKGTGISPFENMSCMGCDGSGKHYEVHYGVQNKAPFAYIIQYGIDGLKEYCKAQREAEMANIRVEKAMLKAFELPPYLRVDLIAEGWPVDEMMQSGELRPLANKIAREYPEFMCTNLKTF